MAGVQDSGNPVLDSMVNLMSATTLFPDAENLRPLHDLLLELAEKEPGGLKVRGKDGDISGAKAKSAHVSRR